MATLIFVTHPEVSIDPSKPREEWTLSAKGVQELENLLKKDFWSKVNCVYTSGEVKAYSVAEEISKIHNVNVFKVESLSEINRSSTGFIDGEKYRIAMEDFYIHPADSYKGWETAYEATERIKSCLDELVKDDPEGYFVVIGHAIIGSCLSCYVRGIDPTFNEDNDILASSLEIDWSNKKIIRDWEKYSVLEEIEEVTAL